MNEKAAGRLALGFARCGAQTRLVHVAQQPPWKVVRSFPDERGAARVHLHNVSGGLLSGDRLSASIDVGAGGEAQITTTGSTRIYKAREGGAAPYQELCATVGEGALLEHIPDSVIPYGGSRYVQRSRFDLARDAGLFAWEIVAPGRAGEAFAFDDLQIEAAVFGSTKPLALDAWRLRPSAQQVGAAIRLGTCAYQATFHVCRTGVPLQEWLGWEKEAAEMIERSCDAAKEIWGVSALHQDGMVFRGLASEGLYLADTLIRFWRRMKVKLYGREPVLPRKMF